MSLYRRTMIPLFVAAGFAAAAGFAVAPGFAEVEPEPDPAREAELVALGEQIFFDRNFSKNRTQSCATCHDPDYAFSDPREGKAGRAVSVGDDGESHGDRNTPTLTYASLIPPFHEHGASNYVGGQFWDGRADDLRAQAGQPMLNPVEMGMTSSAEVVERILESPEYVEKFERLFGPDVFEDPDVAFDAGATALAAYQSSPAFSTFDSKYDRVLRGEESFTAEEAFGRSVFLSWNCQLCHMLRDKAATETFTNYEYHNIGVPVNHAARAANGLPENHVDHGLLEREGIDDPRQGGKFRVPTLRNVAVTAPYMHNGIFEDLRTAVMFYNKYTSRLPAAQINPETGEPWGDPEVAENISLKELESGLALDGPRVDALVAFLKTLTDARYEHLLERDGPEQTAASARSAKPES